MRVNTDKEKRIQMMKNLENTRLELRMLNLRLGRYYSGFVN